MARVVTYVIAGCLVVRQLSAGRSRSMFQNPLFLYIAISLALKYQEIYANVKSENVHD